MRFGPVPLDQAEGAVLAHSLPLPDGRLRKGRVLARADIDRIRAADLTEIIVARLDPGDVDENAAAARIAAALVPDPAAAHLRLAAPGTGRVNIHAAAPGVLTVDAARVVAVNMVDPMITVATLPPFAAAPERGVVATVKIISWAVPEAALDRAAHEAAGAVRLHRVRLRSAALIRTDIGAGPGKGEQVMENRLAALGMTLAASDVAPHRTEPLARAIAAAPGDMVLIITASATSDIDDVGPEALRAAGGEVLRFGIPVDPGNLTFLGRLNGRPVLGLPGSVRSPVRSGADWMLERIACGLDVTAADIAAMGVGGLLKEGRARPHPRERR